MVQRRPIPKAVREQVLKEYNHRCAICGEDHPQLHHIDEDPSNNEALNLIPLCPNCHLNGQHNPHQALDEDKLRFFRVYKHPLILKPQFHPLFIRLKFLENPATEEIKRLNAAAADLIDLVKMHEMGEFYAKKIGHLVSMRRTSGITIIGNRASELRRDQRRRADQVKYREQLASVRERVHALVVEMLAYQSW
jgi:uncharacterized protein with HEPN domain